MGQKMEREQWSNLHPKCNFIPGYLLTPSLLFVKFAVNTVEFGQKYWRILAPIVKFADEQGNPAKILMVLIMRDELVNPPTWFSSFRDLTPICSMRLHSDILIETENTDAYHHWLTSRGSVGFVDDFVPLGIVAEIRFDTESNYDPSIIVDRIVPENTNQHYRRIQFASTY